MFLLTACGGSAVDDNLVDCRCVLTNGKRQTANGKRQTANGKRQTAREEAHLRRWPLQGKRRSAEQCQTHDGHLNGINPLLHSEKAKSEDEKTSVSFGPF